MHKIHILAALGCFMAAPALADHDGAEHAEETGAPASMSAEVDLDLAEGIYGRSCRACHGNKAQGVASYPNLSDQTPEEIAAKLETYRAGERVGPNSVLMIQNAKDLSDTEIASLAQYVTSAFD
ncbi:c-type cytochrome [Palleronia sp. LCG004]|uniref:c-type cytochrome n=1 Tax=Palleronia sp. LCG004 TaxID=3079304 RepID=UPI0029435A69|nr:c-type cytochrome [Palleronia sp. LCG004]WOI57831.1 c-type cytochrome [Palleronia sp. LCG004]